MLPFFWPTTMLSLPVVAPPRAAGTKVGAMAKSESGPGAPGHSGELLVGAPGFPHAMTQPSRGEIDCLQFTLPLGMSMAMMDSCQTSSGRQLAVSCTQRSYPAG